MGLELPRVGDVGGGPLPPATVLVVEGAPVLVMNPVVEKSAELGVKTVRRAERLMARIRRSGSTLSLAAATSISPSAKIEGSGALLRVKRKIRRPLFPCEIGEGEEFRIRVVIHVWDVYYVLGCEARG